jgi:DNA-binding transcriptional LysR family regulator
MGERHLDLDLLRTFLAVVRSGSFTRAAAVVHVTQSAISRQMRDLERSLGAALFERFGRGVHLTAAGDALVGRAERILLEARDTLQVIEEIKAGVAGELRIGATITAANYVLPDLLAEYRRKHPRVRLVLAPASTPKLLHQVQRNELDLAVVGQVPADTDLKTWQLIDDEVVLFAARAHPLTRKKTVSLQAIAAEDLILRDPGSDTRKLVEHWAQQTGASLRVLMDMW